jgi:hypothetical protein
MDAIIYTPGGSEFYCSNVTKAGAYYQCDWYLALSWSEKEFELSPGQRPYGNLDDNGMIYGEPGGLFNNANEIVWMR